MPKAVPIWTLGFATLFVYVMETPVDCNSEKTPLTPEVLPLCKTTAQPPATCGAAIETRFCKSNRLQAMQSKSKSPGLTMTRKKRCLNSCLQCRLHRLWLPRSLPRRYGLETISPLCNNCFRQPQSRLPLSPRSNRMRNRFRKQLCPTEKSGSC